MRTISFLAAALLTSCNGVRVGGQTLIPPMARPAASGSSGAGGAGAAWQPPSPAPDEDTQSDDVQYHEPTAVEPAVLAARAATGCFVAGQHFTTMPPSNGPVDPWRAVDHGRPRVLPHQMPPSVLRGEDTRCDAAHDHCLLDCDWLVTTDVGDARSVPWAQEREAIAGGSFDGLGPDDDFIAFRTLPATRKNLVAGALIVVADGEPSRLDGWSIGLADSIDWEERGVRLQGRPAIYDLAWARIVVLQYRRGGAVEQIVPAERLAIAPGDLVAAPPSWRD